MTTTRDFQKIFTMESKIIEEQTSDLTHADSLLQPQPGGNCLNWVLGHLITSQLEIISAIGGKPPFDPASVTRYDRNSEPIRGDEPGVLDLSTLVKMNLQVNSVIDTLVSGLDGAALDREIQIGERKMTLGWRIFFLHFHYVYHIGQLEYLRQLAGKLDKLI
jgi:hypothetical protein